MKDPNATGQLLCSFCGTLGSLSSIYVFQLKVVKDPLAALICT